MAPLNRSSVISATLMPSSCPSTSSVCSPSSGPAHRVLPGVPLSFGTMAGTVTAGAPDGGAVTCHLCQQTVLCILISCTEVQGKGWLLVLLIINGDLCGDRTSNIPLSWYCCSRMMSAVLRIGPASMRAHAMSIIARCIMMSSCTKVCASYSPVMHAWRASITPAGTRATAIASSTSARLCSPTQAPITCPCSGVAISLDATDTATALKVCTVLSHTEGPAAAPHRALMAAASAPFHVR